MANQPGIAALSSRAHIFVRPEARTGFTTLFRDVLGCEVIERNFGLPHPILYVPFGDGSGFSVEFSELAPQGHAGAEIDDEHAFRGAWLEFRTINVADCQQKLRDAGICEFRHLGSTHVYFSAPGGQVFRVVDVDYKGP